MDTDKHGLQRPKLELRYQIRAALKNLTAEKRAADSLCLCARLKEQAFWKNAASVLFFAPLPGEVDVWPLLAEAVAGGKIVTLPRFDQAGLRYTACRVQNLRSEIVIGKFGIREPSPRCVEIALNQIDLVLVPGVAFDLRGNRLGRGKGFYDRLLADVRGVKCGIAFDEQIVETVPAGKMDVKMNFILTPTRCINCVK